MIWVRTSPKLGFPDGRFELANHGEGGHVVEVAALGREPERKVGENVPEGRKREVQAHATDVLQTHLFRILVFQDIPISQKLKGKKEGNGHI